MNTCPTCGSEWKATRLRVGFEPGKSWCVDTWHNEPTAEPQKPEPKKSEQFEFPLDDKHHGAARRVDPQTSHDAAESVEANELESLVLDDIRAQGRYGATPGETAFRLKIEKNTISPRHAPLRRKGFIFDSGIRRPNPTGRSGQVWVSSREFVSENPQNGGKENGKARRHGNEKNKTTIDYPD